MTAPKYLPLAAFPRSFRALLLKGALEEVQVKCASLRQARALRTRLHHFRRTARLEKDPVWEQLFRPIITVPETDPPVCLIRPRDLEFSDVLAAAGIEDATADELISPGYDPLAEFDIELKNPGRGENSA